MIIAISSNDYINAQISYFAKNIQLYHGHARQFQEFYPHLICINNNAWPLMRCSMIGVYLPSGFCLQNNKKHGKADDI